MKLTRLLVATIAISAIWGSNVFASGEVNVYSARKENLIKPLLDKFTEKTGIKTNLITSKADKLLVRLKSEGRNSPADLFITTDAGRLYRAKQKGGLQPINSSVIDQLVPDYLRDQDGLWVALSQRLRVIFYAKDRVKVEELSSYEALSESKWKHRICVRSSNNIYNQSLLASMIKSNGEQNSEKWARGIVANMARPPVGGDRDQIKAVAAGQCDVTLANTYYYGMMLNSDQSSEDYKAAKKLEIFWPNQSDRGAHVNVSGAGIAKYAPNRSNAIKLLEFLLSKESQQWYAEVNYEYPVRSDVESSELLKKWGEFKSDNINLTQLGINNIQAVKIMDKVGWR